MLLPLFQWHQRPCSLWKVSVLHGTSPVLPRLGQGALGSARVSPATCSARTPAGTPLLGGDIGSPALYLLHQWCESLAMGLPTLLSWAWPGGEAAGSPTEPSKVGAWLLSWIAPPLAPPVPSRWGRGALLRHQLKCPGRNGVITLPRTLAAPE